MSPPSIQGYDAAKARTWPARMNQAASDLYGGLTKSWLWGELAKQDIKLRYRGSMLGPLWMTLSTAIWIAAMGFLYAKLFNSPAEKYLPFLSVGLVMWGFLSSLITEGCGTFTVVSSIIQQVKMPVSIHVYRLVLRNLIALAHNMIIIPFILLIFHIVPDWRCLWIPPALLLMSINGVWIAILLGMIASRYRDVTPIVSSFVQVVFFVTPIFWPPESLGKWAAIGQLNPLFAAIDLVRAPILGLPLGHHSWGVLVATTIVGSAFTFFVFSRFRYRIPFWV